MQPCTLTAADKKALDFFAELFFTEIIVPAMVADGIVKKDCLTIKQTNHDCTNSNGLRTARPSNRKIHNPISTGPNDKRYKAPGISSPATL